MKKWKFFGDECPECGCVAEVLTDAEDGCAYDADDARCSECDAIGMASINDEIGVAYIVWDEKDEISTAPQNT